MDHTSHDRKARALHAYPNPIQEALIGPLAEVMIHSTQKVVDLTDTQ